MVKFGQIWKWSYSKHVYQIPCAVCETAWDPSESPYGPDLDCVKYGPRNNSDEVDQLSFWHTKIWAVKTRNSTLLFTAFNYTVSITDLSLWPVRVELLEIISDENLWYLLRSKMKRYQNDILGFMIYTCLISWLLLGFSRNRKISNFENPRFILKFSQFQKSENRGIINRELKSVRLKIASTAQIGK